MNEEFKKWWEELTEKSDNWTTLERMAAMEAWRYKDQQNKALLRAIESWKKEELIWNKENKDLKDLLGSGDLVEYCSKLQIENKELRDALMMLVTAKKHKDQIGKDDTYLSMKEVAWKKANEVLNLTP